MAAAAGGAVTGESGSGADRTVRGGAAGRGGQRLVGPGTAQPSPAAGRDGPAPSGEVRQRGGSVARRGVRAAGPCGGAAPPHWGAPCRAAADRSCRGGGSGGAVVGRAPGANVALSRAGPRSKAAIGERRTETRRGEVGLGTLLGAAVEQRFVWRFPPFASFYLLLFCFVF